MTATRQAHITQLTVDAQSGLLLWATREDWVPRSLKTLFATGRWRAGVPLWLPDKKGRLERTESEGWWLPAGQAASALAALPLRDLRHQTPSIAVWTLAAKWVVEAVSRHQLVPGLTADPSGHGYEAVWRVAPVRTQDRSRIGGLADAMPGVARCGPVTPDSDEVLTATAALHQFLDAAADGLMRAPTETTAPHPGHGPRWLVRFAKALAGPKRRYDLLELGEKNLPNALGRWTASATSFGSGDRPIVGFRLEEPRSKRDQWYLSYHLNNSTTGLRIAVSDLAQVEHTLNETTGDLVRPRETLLEALTRACNIFLPIERSLSQRLPEGLDCDANEAWQFLTEASLDLEHAGYQVEVPAALSRVGRRRVRARMRLKASHDDDHAPSGLLEAIVNYQWEASLGDDTLTAREFRALVRAKAPLVLHRGQWVAVDPEEVERLTHLIERGSREISAARALQLALMGEIPVPESPDQSATVVTEGRVAAALTRLREGVSAEEADSTPAPEGLNATLRHYQHRGFAWLMHVTDIGFGACLADDMGLGKTLQLLALAQQLGNQAHGIRCLVVCPTSVLGNWRREIQRFAPQLHVVIHHGASRASTKDKFIARSKKRRPKNAIGCIYLTSYALVRGDIDMLEEITFDLIALDEAQNIKNPETAQSQAVRRLRSHRRLALTGTPIENRLSELWSIGDFLNPGLLGNRNSFKRQFAIPIERYGDTELAQQLKRLTAPFLLRRLKTDPSIAPELPDKVELVRYCPLTREQAALYKQTVDDCMEEISSLEGGIQRRGMVLSMLTRLKQICNHPCHLLGDDDLSATRSGKTIRFLELVEEMLAAGGNGLVFTQYRVMGELLQAQLKERFGDLPPFLHGGLSRHARDRAVANFQDPSGPRVMIVSLKAGGTGLNLTRSNHVFHYDRWWNPAVEDQATDRAFRIGQTRDVTVHRLVCQGTLEEQIDKLLREKRNLADRVINVGETWLSNMADDELAEFITLGQDAVLE